MPKNDEGRPKGASGSPCGPCRAALRDRRATEPLPEASPSSLSRPKKAVVSSIATEPR